MKYEFRGPTIESAVRNSLRYKKNVGRCHILELEYESLALSLTRLPRALDRVNNRITRLKGKIEDEAETQSTDRKQRLIVVAIAVASLVPAARAVSAAASAVSVATNFGRAKGALDSLSAAVVAVGAIGITGLELLKPSTKQQMEDAQNDMADILEDIDQAKEQMARILRRMEREGCDMPTL